MTTFKSYTFVYFSSNSIDCHTNLNTNYATMGQNIHSISSHLPCGGYHGRRPHAARSVCGSLCGLEHPNLVVCAFHLHGFSGLGLLSQYQVDEQDDSKGGERYAERADGTDRKEEGDAGYA